MEKRDILGQRFGRLTVIAPAPTKHRRARWICQCDCNSPAVTTTGRNLVSGRKKSCGCLRREMGKQRAILYNSTRDILPDGEAAFNYLYANYRYHAEERDLDFPLSKDDFKNLTKGTCVYCGVSPYQMYSNTNLKSQYIYNGVDRKDNSLGYTLENSVSCCGICNDMKRRRSAEEFVLQCKAISEYYNHKKPTEMIGSVPQEL